MQKIIPAIWFVHGIEEAVELYTSLIPDSKINKITHYSAEAAKRPDMGFKAGDVLTIAFTLDGQDYLAINGGDADFVGKGAGRVSLMVQCEDQAEIDKLWSALTDGGNEWPCGWCTDKYGITWQIVPKAMDQLMGDSDAAWKAMMGMKKLDIAKLKAAANE